MLVLFVKALCLSRTTRIWNLYTISSIFVYDGHVSSKYVLRSTLNNFVTEELWRTLSCLLIYISYHHRLLRPKFTLPSSKSSLSFRCPINFIYVFFFSHILTPCPVLLIELDLITRIICVDGVKIVNILIFFSVEIFLPEPLYSQRIGPVDHFTNSLETVFLEPDPYGTLQFEVTNLYVHCPLLAWFQRVCSSRDLVNHCVTRYFCKVNTCCDLDQPKSLRISTCGISPTAYLIQEL